MDRQARGVFLDLRVLANGRIGGNVRMPGGVVDVAKIQSLKSGNVADDAVAGFRHLVVDERHHFEACRSPIVLTDRKDHAGEFAGTLGCFARNVLLLRGGMGQESAARSCSA